MRVQMGGAKYAKAKYDRLCMHKSKEEVLERQANGESYIIRMKIPDSGYTEFKDIVHGKVKFEHKVIDDQVILKNDGFPTYHFANVVDDYLMGITHVIRGEEWLPSTPKHLLLYKMLGIDPPQFAHLPLILNSKGQKLSKRFGDVAVRSYKDKGFMPAAMLNGIALMGWNPPHREDASLIFNESTGVFLKQEVLTMDDMINQFNIDKISKSGAKFDLAKLEYFNSQHITNGFSYVSDDEKRTAVDNWRKMLIKELPDRLKARILKMDNKRMVQVMDMMKIRIRYHHDILNHKYLFEDPDYTTELAVKFYRKIK